MRKRATLLAATLLLTACSSILPSSLDRDDPRFAACGGTAANATAAFPFRAADYQRHFPRMGRSPELEVDASAFAVVFAPDFAPGPAVLPNPGRRYVCIYVGNVPDGTYNMYGDVDITGMPR